LQTNKDHQDQIMDSIIYCSNEAGFSSLLNTCKTILSLESIQMCCFTMKNQIQIQITFISFMELNSLFYHFFGIMDQLYLKSNQKIHCR